MCTRERAAKRSLAPCAWCQAWPKAVRRTVGVTLWVRWCDPQRDAGLTCAASEASGGFATRVAHCRVTPSEDDNQELVELYLRTADA